MYLEKVNYTIHKYGKLVHTKHRFVLCIKILECVNHYNAFVLFISVECDNMATPQCAMTYAIGQDGCNQTAAVAVTTKTESSTVKTDDTELTAAIELTCSNYTLYSNVSGAHI